MCWVSYLDGKGHLIRLKMSCITNRASYKSQEGNKLYLRLRFVIDKTTAILDYSFLIQIKEASVENNV